jgi:hypothetical protein
MSYDAMRDEFCFWFRGAWLIAEGIEIVFYQIS